MRIMLVDDNPIDQMIMQSELENSFHEVITADSGEQAIDIFQEVNPDLIFMDEVMPGISGKETVKAIRKIQDSWIPIVFISANTTPEAILAGIEAGGDDYLLKPVNSLTIKAKIESLSRFVDMRRQLIRLNFELNHKNERLHELADHDGLTGLSNRRYLDNFAQQALNKAQRDNEYLSIIMIDIDWFKLFNDHYGHLKGDECIIAVAEAMQGRIKRETDCIARYGGEEFCVILQNTDIEGAQAVAYDIKQLVAELKIQHKLSAFDYVSISLGVFSAVPDNELMINDVISYADKALYYSKQHGRNGVSIYSDNMRPHT